MTDAIDEIDTHSKHGKAGNEIAKDVTSGFHASGIVRVGGSLKSTPESSDTGSVKHAGTERSCRVSSTWLLNCATASKYMVLMRFIACVTYERIAICSSRSFLATLIISS